MSTKTEYLFRAHKVRNMNTLSKMVLTTLADRANHAGQSWYSFETIAELCGCSSRSVKRHVKLLQTGGYLRVEKRFKAGMKDSNLYTLNLSALPDVTESHYDVTESHYDVTESPVGCDSVSNGSDTVSHNPLNDPLSNPLSHRPNNYSKVLPMKASGKARGGRPKDRSLEDHLSNTSWAD
jgi:biotin operon repressor